MPVLQEKFIDRSCGLRCAMWPEVRHQK